MTSIANTNTTLNQQMYSLKEVAAILNLSQKTVHRLVQRGLLTRSHALRHIRIPRQSVESFIQATQ